MNTQEPVSNPIAAVQAPSLDAKIAAMHRPADGTPSGGYYDPRVFDKRLRELLASGRILPRSREASLVVTKLEEALLWLGEVPCGSTDGPMVGTLK